MSRRQLTRAQADAWLRLSGRWDSALEVEAEIESICSARTGGGSGSVKVLDTDICIEILRGNTDVIHFGGVNR